MNLKALEKLCQSNGVPLTSRGVNRPALESSGAVGAALGHLKSVELPLPPSNNHLFPTGKDGKRYMSKEYREWRKAAHPLVALLRPATKYPVEVWITLAGRDVNQQRDVANFEKAVGDALVEMRVIRDDCLPYVAGTHQVYYPDDGEPRVIVQLTTKRARAPKC